MSKIFELFPKAVAEVEIPSRPAGAVHVEYKKAPTRIESLKLAGKLLPAPTPAWVVDVRKEVHAILGFAGHVVFNLDGATLSAALAQAKHVGNNAFLQTVQEYFLACKANGITPDTNLATPVAKEVYSMAVEVEEKSIRATLISALAEVLREHGVSIPSFAREVVDSGTKATREHVAQATRSNKMAVREAVATMSTGRVVASSATPVGQVSRVAKTQGETKPVNPVKVEAKAQDLRDVAKLSTALIREYKVVEVKFDKNSLITLTLLSAVIKEIRLVLHSLRNCGDIVDRFVDSTTNIEAQLSVGLEPKVLARKIAQLTNKYFTVKKEVKKSYSKQMGARKRGVKGRKSNKRSSK